MKIEFYRVKDEYGCFSNFSPHPLVIDGSFYYTSEHYFQSEKFEDFTYQQSIRAAKSPMIAARMGRNKEMPLREDWEESKCEIMKKALWAKVMQHSDVREALIGTGRSEIVEHTKNDSFWADGGDGSGKNMLGKLLMELRDELTKDGPFNELANELLPPWMKYPDIASGSIGWRMGAGEGYLYEWALWHGGLSEKGKKEYQAKFPTPDDWES